MSGSAASISLRRAEDLPELLTRSELAAFTGIAMSTLARWATEGSGPRMVKLGAHVRYRRADVLAWLDASAMPADKAAR